LFSDDVEEGHSNISAAQVDIFSQPSYKEKYPQLLALQSSRIFNARELISMHLVNEIFF
jgi:hypothetical protein